MVHALGSQNNAVREFALRELVQSGVLPDSYARAKDFTGALLEFTKAPSISIRYRAVLGLEGKTGRQIVSVLLPLIMDKTTVYNYPSAATGWWNHRTVHQAVVSCLIACRETNEDDILPLLASQNYKERLAGIEVFAGSASARVKAVLLKLSTDDEYQKVREAAAQALKGSWRCTSHWIPFADLD